MIDHLSGSREPLRERLRRERRSLARFTGLRFWTMFRGLPAAVVLGTFYLACGATIGWRMTYDIAVGITSPGDVPFPVLAWVLSVIGWLLVPGIAGAVAGYVVTTQIDGRRGQPLHELLPPHLQPPEEPHG